MPVHVALLRGINVGGRKMIAMSDLRALLGKLGFAGVRTLLQSGNLVFQSDRKSTSELERLLEVEIEKKFQQTVTCLVRTAAEWRSIVVGNPFTEAAERDPSHLLVVCLRKVPKEEVIDSLISGIKGPEIVRAKGKQLYIVYPAGIGTSKLTNSLIEQKLDTRGSGRNWNTVLKLAALLEE